MHFTSRTKLVRCLRIPLGVFTRKFFSRAKCQSRFERCDLMWPKKKTILVEGNIGSGKTTLLNYFAHFPQTMVMQEPVDKWTNFHGCNLLELMYKDPKRWSCSFQWYVLLTMLASHQQMHTSPVKLMERSLYSARYCFIENLYANGFLHDIEYRMFTEWFNYLVKNGAGMHVDLIVYLHTNPQVAFGRIQARSRREEEVVPFEYVEKLHIFHEQWLRGGDSSILPASVVVLDANKSMEEMLLEYKRCEDVILSNK